MPARPGIGGVTISKKNLDQGFQFSQQQIAAARLLRRRFWPFHFSPCTNVGYDNSQRLLLVEDFGVVSYEVHYGEGVAQSVCVDEIEGLIQGDERELTRRTSWRNVGTNKSKITDYVMRLWAHKACNGPDVFVSTPTRRTMMSVLQKSTSLVDLAPVASWAFC